MSTRLISRHRRPRAGVVLTAVLLLLVFPVSAQVIGEVSSADMTRQLEDAKPETIFFVNANVLDATRETPLEGVTVEVAGGRIAAITSDESLELMAERGTYLTPTLAVARDLTGIGGDYDAVRLRIRGAHIFPALQDTARRAREAGVNVVTGTDTAHGEGSMVRIGQELAELVEVGYMPMEALRAATLNGAELLGIADRTGRIVEGYEADLMVVPANPLTDIIQVQDPLVVVTDGRLVRNRLPFGTDR